MSDEEHSDSEFYYPDDEQEKYDTNFHQFLSNEEQPSELCEQQNNENSQEEFDNFLKQQKSKNTLNKTSSDMKAFNHYLQTTNKQYLNILNLSATELDHLLSKFFKNIRKLNGEEYEPNTISSFQRSIQRFLRDNKSQFNILSDKEFELSRQVLVAKRKHLVNKAGKGNKPNTTRSLTQKEEDKLFEYVQFGMSGPEVLQRTVWWFLAFHFGFRARYESRKLCWGDIQLQINSNGREMLVWLSLSVSKLLILNHFVSCYTDYYTEMLFVRKHF